jgi:hypothetical protein
MKFSYHRLFIGNIAPWQRALIAFGAFAGLLLLWVPMQLYADLSNAIAGQTEMFSDHYLVLNKEVTFMKALGATPDVFSEEEVQELTAVPGVQAVGAFSSNTFRATASADYDGAPMFRTELFFESVPDRFLDQKPRGWNWEPADGDVPVILPSDYLALYNFGFAPGHGLPQISEQVATMSDFTIVVSGQDRQQSFKGRIAGFSDRVNTILAPQSFLQHCNEQFGQSAAKPPSRVIVETSDADALGKVLKEKGYETNSESLRAGKTQALARKVLTASLLLALVVMLISFGSFLQFSDLLIARSEMEIKSMAYLGFSHAFISRSLFRQVLSLVAFSALAALVAGCLLRMLALNQMESLFKNARWYPEWWTALSLIMALGTYLVVLRWHLRRKVTRMCKPA